jgi:hypothetical protein
LPKRFDLDAGKRRARKRLRLFVKKRVFNRKSAHVLCMPGEYGIEIEDVYRKLGFRDCNIFGVERHAKAAKAIQERYPGIYVHHGDLLDFVRQYEGPPFDVVSLDYCGKATVEKLKPLALLSAFNLMAPKCVVHFNVMAGRERKEVQTTLRNSYARILFDKRLHKGEPIPAGDLTQIQGILDEAGEEDLSRVREDAVTNGVLAQSSYLVPAMKVAGRYNLKECTGSMIHVPVGAQVMDSIEGGERSVVIHNAKLVEKDLMAVATAIKHEAIQSVNKTLREARVTEYLKAEVRAKMPDFDASVIDYHFGRDLVMFFYDKHGEAHLPVDLERYSYISESGRRMITDLVLFRSFEKELASIPNPIFPADPDEGEKGDHRFCLYWPETYKDNPAGWIQWLKRIHNRYATKVAQYCKSLPEHWPERIDLGGGTVTMTEEKVKARVVEYIKAGRDNEYILRKFPTLKKGSLAAIRAHVTMGTY